jgi:hypothetical protein
VIENHPICLSKLIRPRSRYWLDLYPHYKNGVMPISGGLLDQPNSFLMAMRVIDQWVAKSGRSKS